MAKISTVDLFCGAGGFTEGFSKAGGFEAALAIDFDQQAIETFRHNHPNINAICANISFVSNSDILELTKNKPVDIVVGGPPCQGFSLAGLRLHDDPKNQLFVEFVRFVDILKPQCFVFENVAGLTSMQNGLVLEAIYDEFYRCGYELSHAVLNSADYGVPQARPRLIIIGSRDGQKMSMPPMTHGNKEHQNWSLFEKDTIPHLSVKDALSNLPVVYQSEGHEEMANLVAINEYQKSVAGTRITGSLFNHRATRHSQKIVERYAAMEQGKNGTSLPIELQTKKHNFYRLNESKPSRTVTCNFRTDIIHPWLPRGLTTREAARLQSFDDDYQFFGNLTRKAKFLTQDDQVGNAVPPLFAKAIANHIKSFL